MNGGSASIYQLPVPIDEAIITRTPECFQVVLEKADREDQKRCHDWKTEQKRCSSSGSNQSPWCRSQFRTLCYRSRFRSQRNRYWSKPRYQVQKKVTVSQNTKSECNENDPIEES